MNKKKKQKFIKNIGISLHIINALLVIGFIIYLYFWIKART
jgi:uncharacterized membrane protein YukC